MSGLHPSVLRAMKDAGASVEVILAAIEAQEALDEARRESLRESNTQRQRNYRHKVSQRDRRDPPNDNISNPPASPPSLANAKDCAPKFSETIVESWNAPGCFRKANPLAGGRLKKLNLRVKEFGEEALLKAIRCLTTSDWHTGKINGRDGKPWKANLGWLLNSEENVNKALEFDDPGERKTIAPTDRAAQLEASARAYRIQGRDNEALEFERQAARLRAA